MPKLPRLSRPLGLLAALAVMACSDTSSIAPTAASVRRDSADHPQIVKCESDQTYSASALVLPLIGGTVAVDGTSITIPANGLLSPETIVVTVPESHYMEIDVSALGVEHLLFQQPATITLDYSRCTDPSLATTPVTVWYIDPQTHQLLENMNGVDDKTTHRITFTTGHLSGYAIAN